MESFARNAILVLFGSTMLLGMGLVGIFGATEDLSPGLQRLMSGPAPYWLAGMGGLGIAAVIAIYLKGSLPQEKDGQSGVPGESTTAPASKEDGIEDGEEPEEGPPLSDVTLTLFEFEVLLRPRENESSPALGPEVPPSAVCASLYEAKDAWLSATMRSKLFEKLAAGRGAFLEASGSVTQTIPVRGRADGEAASYRLVFLVHVPPSSTFNDASSALKLLGRLPGDRYLETAMVRVPEEAETFSSPMNVAGSLAAENLLEDAPGGEESSTDVEEA